MGKITLKSFIISTLFIMVIAFMYFKNKDTSKGIENNVSDKMLIKKAKQEIDSIKQSSLVEDTIMDLIINLSDDYQKHKNIGNKLSEKEIEKIEQKLNLELPESYKLFLKYFGDGADLVYNTSILKSNNTTFLSDQYKNFQEDIETSEGIIKSSSLLALTKQNKDKEAWYWLTNDDIDEWSLVYFSAKEKSIIHTIEDFSKWLELLVKGKNNVITEIGKQSGGNSNNEAVTLNYLE